MQGSVYAPPAAQATDLFGNPLPAHLCVRLERTIDRLNPCCDNIATVEPRSGPHAAALHCASCNRFRGWLARDALGFLQITASRLGASGQPLPLRDSTIGSHSMQKSGYDNKNSGALFKNERKEKDADRDYSGSVNVEGREFWLSGWIKTSKAGVGYLSLSLKPKDAAAGVAKKPAGAPFDDAIGF
jgi:hypothetical protein